MPKFRVKVTQTVRLERVCILDAEADDPESAVEEQSAGDAPGSTRKAAQPASSNTPSKNPALRRAQTKRGIRGIRVRERTS